MGKIEIILGDITTLKCDVIVNAANSGLLGGGGVDGAIHRAGGPIISCECKEIVRSRGRCKTGEAVITNSGNLLCKKVIHTVGPIWRGGNNDEDRLLGMCYINSLDLMDKYGFSSIAFPNISTGIYGFPKDRAAKVGLSCVLDYLKRKTKVDRVIFVCFDIDNYNIYKRMYKE